MRIAQIKPSTEIDGPGRRIAIFLQGCSIRCSGCQNQHLWPAEGGEEWDPAELARHLFDSGLPITITGGEPFDQPEELAELLTAIRILDPDRHIIVYTGYTLEHLLDGLFTTVQFYAAWILHRRLIDVLVDGPYIRALDPPEMQYRGSLNQRPIEVPATMERWPYGDVVTLDWDTPEVILTPEGDLLVAAPLACEFAEVGNVVAVRSCGQTT